MEYQNQNHVNQQTIPMHLLVVEIICICLSVLVCIVEGSSV